ncbi:MAG: 16S rRNA (adenine(1518)-N(6)/adenine(1519)-N(6))-dimethyltransferase RsmA [Dissulfurispiraceae bacterium]|jgi:16S rRNA (adenine1518-N6/adenine1519-N6)-dimethyltransferase
MAKKSLGQNFLFDPAILGRIIEAAGIGPDDTVVEIGPGPGRLTLMLSKVSQRVLAIELDSDLYIKLQDELTGRENVELVLGDALKYRYDELGSFKVVANIPYYITTPIIFKLIEARSNLVSMTLTIQKEVAQRIVANPGTKDYGILSLALQYHADAEIKFIIPAGAFRPAPKVDSAIIHMVIRSTPKVIVANEALFFKLIRAGFSQRRKTLSNALKLFMPNIKDILIDSGIDPIRRAETLSMDEFAKLANAIHRIQTT